MSLGERIRARRRELGLSQKELAHRLGVTPQAVSRWEKDLAVPTLPTFSCIVEILGVSADFLIGGKIFR